MHKTNDQIGQSDRYVFYSNFWVNMHHFLYNQSLAIKEAKGDKPIGQFEWKKISSSEKEILNTVFNYYQDSLLQYDLRTGDVHFYFKKWCIGFSEKNNLPKFEHNDSINTYLNLVKPIYQKYFWPKHNAANKKVLSDNLALIKKYENRAVERLEELTQHEWVKEKIRVDVSFHSKLERPYTNTHGGVHVVMDSGNNARPKGNWLELLFHETSHHLIFPSKCYVGDLIKKTAEETGMKAPRQLWHAYLFYFTGVVTREYMIEEGFTDYELYMVRERPFYWVYPWLDKYLPKYINGEASLEEVTKELITDWNTREKK